MTGAVPAISVRVMRGWVSGFAAALAVIGGSAYLAISVGALLGLNARPGVERTAVVVVTLALAFLLHDRDGQEWRGGAWLGIAVGLIGTVGLELVAANPSVGAGQIGALFGAIVVFPALSMAGSGIPGSTYAMAGLGMLVAFVAIALVRTIVDGGALGHDEAAYALKARSWVAGTPETGWQLHRAPLNSLLATPIVAFTESEVALRLVAALLATGSLLAGGLVAMHRGGPWAGVVAVATVGTSLSFLRRGSEFLTDVPSAGLLLLAVWMVLRAMSDPDRYGRWLVWLGPLVLAAFYMRYQSALAVIGIALAASIAWPSVVRRLIRPLTIAGGLAVAGLVPHLIWATVVAGAPWGIVLLTGDAGGRQFLGEGLVDYAAMFPVELAGPAGAVVTAIGLVWALWKSGQFLFGRRDPDHRAALFILVVVVVAVVPLGLVAHGEPRFVFLPVWLLIAAGAGVLVGIFSRLRQPYLALTVAIAGLVWLPLFAETVRRVDRNAEARGETLTVLVEASNLIEVDGPGDCAVLTTYQPQVTWYSACETELLRLRAGSLGQQLLEADREYVLLFENGKRQPALDVIAEHLDLSEAETIAAANDRLGDATIVDVTSG